MIDKRGIADDSQSRSADLDSVAVDDDALTPLTEHNTDGPGRRQLRLPSFIFSGSKGLGLDRLAADKLYPSELPRVRDLLRRSCLSADHDRHAVRRNLEEPACKLAWQVNATMRFRITGQSASM
jgi:hypothetical protein